MVEQVFLLMREDWSMHNADTQCTVGGEGRPKGREEFLCLNLSCLAIKHEFYFIVVLNGEEKINLSGQKYAS